MNKPASSRRNGVKGSRFNGRATATLHDHRASAEYIDGRVRVGVSGETAGSTGEASLALAACFVDGSTGRAGLRRIRGIDFNKRPATLFDLVGQHVLEVAPALFVNAPSNSSVSANHARRVQVFERDMPELARNIGASFVPPIGANAGDLRGKAGHPNALLAISVRPSLAAGKDALSAFLSALQAVGCRCGQKLASGQCEGVGDAPIDPNATGQGAWGFVFDLASEDNVPAQSIADYCHAQAAATNLTGLPKPHPSELRNPNLAPAPIDRARLGFDTLEPEGRSTGALSEVRVARSASEEVGKGGIKVAQDLRQRGCVFLSKPGAFTPKLRQLAALRDKVEAASWSPERSPLLQREIVNETDSASRLLKRDGLLWRRIKTLSKGPLNHALFLARINGARQENERAQPSHRPIRRENNG